MKVIDVTLVLGVIVINEVITLHNYLPVYTCLYVGSVGFAKLSSLKQELVYPNRSINKSYK